jgi:protein TonB
MAYADQSMSGSKVTALIIVALIHVVVGYALVTGLAYSAAKQILKKVTTVDVKEEEKPKEPPPPPPKVVAPPPVVVPPPKVNVAVSAPVIESVQAPPPAPPPPVYVAPAAPPPPRFTPKGAAPKGNPGNWATANDYPSRALREEREGTTGFRVTVGPDGRVTECQITSPSGSPDLDQTACDKIRQRARFTPATDGDGNPTTGSYSNRVRWVIPKD